MMMVTLRHQYEDNCQELTSSSVWLTFALFDLFQFGDQSGVELWLCKGLDLCPLLFLSQTHCLSDLHGLCSARSRPPQRAGVRCVGTV